ncbi:MAG: hypothetical protein Q8N17_21300, partial [Burkholderiaceae bacterium]|nr:hypothetical protein [Burkholderiaceae bacterium]
MRHSVRHSSRGGGGGGIGQGVDLGEKSCDIDKKPISWYLGVGPCGGSLAYRCAVFGAARAPEMAQRYVPLYVRSAIAPFFLPLTGKNGA